MRADLIKSDKTYICISGSFIRIERKGRKLVIIVHHGTEDEVRYEGIDAVEVSP